MTIFEKVQAAGIPHDNHSSDLYIPVTEETKALVAQYEHKTSVTVFTSQIDGKSWFDIPFAYEPFWKDAERQVNHWAANASN